MLLVGGVAFGNTTNAFGSCAAGAFTTQGAAFVVAVGAGGRGAAAPIGGDKAAAPSVGRSLSLVEFRKNGATMGDDAGMFSSTPVKRVWSFLAQYVGRPDEYSIERSLLCLGHDLKESTS